MKTITLPAHFDGEKICVDEPYNFKKNLKLIVTVLPLNENGADTEHDVWLQFSGERLANAYGKNEPEYSFNMIKDRDSDYERR